MGPRSAVRQYNNTIFCSVRCFKSQLSLHKPDLQQVCIPSDKANNLHNITVHVSYIMVTQTLTQYRYTVGFSPTGGLYWPPKTLLLSWTERVEQFTGGVEPPQPPGNSNPDSGPWLPQESLTTRYLALGMHTCCSDSVTYYVDKVATILNKNRVIVVSHNTLWAHRACHNNSVEEREDG